MITRTEEMKLITFDGKKNTVWATIHNDDEFKKVMQYVLDNMSNATEFLLLREDIGVTYDAYLLATKMHGMHKRTFEERMHSN